MAEKDQHRSAESYRQFAEATKLFLVYTQASGCSPNTTRAYQHDLTHLSSFLSTHGVDWVDLTPAGAVDLLTHLRAVPSRRRGQPRHPSLAAVEGQAIGPGLTAATINRVLSAVSSFYDWARMVGRFDGPNPIARVHDRAAAEASERHRPFLTRIGGGQPMRNALRLKSIRRLPRPMSADQIAALTAQLRSRRDRALIRLMLDGVLRPGEVLGLHPTDVAYGRRRIVMRVRDDHPRGVRSKSRTERVVDLHETATLEAVSAYVMQERPAEATSPILFLVGGRGRRRCEPLSYAALVRLFARACSRAGIRTPWITPHALRHTHATRMWEAGMRELTLQRRLGHASPESTRLYTRVSDSVVVAEYRRALGLEDDHANQRRSAE
jgi:integrase/recombinase XerD